MHLNNRCRKNSTASNADANIENQSAVVQEDLTQEDEERKKFYWNTVPRSMYQKDLEEIYEQFINKKFINEITINGLMAHLRKMLHFRQFMVC